MEEIQKFKLIEGEFKPSEARNILFALVNSKINFHSLESFGITVRSSGDTSFHERRMRELGATNRDIKAVMDYASHNNFRLKIHSLIEIKLIDEQR